MAKILFILTVALLAIIVASDSFKCFDCDPRTDQEKCDDPEEKGAVERSCQTENDKIIVCTATYLKGEGTEEGIYRGCELIGVNDKDKACEIIKEKATAQNVTVSSCDACYGEHLCNKKKVSSPNSGSSLKSIQCIDCEEGNCENPRIKLCNETSGMEAECFSCYIESHVDHRAPTGTYKGCLPNACGRNTTCKTGMIHNEVLEYNRKVRTCNFCNTDLCNNKSGNVVISFYLILLSVVVFQVQG